MSNVNRLVRIGFIGCGGHANNSLYPTFRLGVIKQTQFGPPAGELIACCDLDERRARQTAQQFGFERSYTDYREMLAREQLDCVFVVMPPRPQSALAAECLKAGLPVFVEKPAAASLADALKLREAARQSGKPLMIGFMKRFSDPYRRARELMQRPEFGPPTTFEARYCFGKYAPFSRNEFIVSFSSHVLDLARFFMGDVVEVNASYVSRAGGAFERPKSYQDVLQERTADLAQEEAWLINLRFASGAIGFIQTNCLERVQERVQISGVGSWLVVDDWRQVKGYVGDVELPYFHEPNGQSPTDRMDFRTLHGYTGEVRHFVECVRDGVAPSPNIDDGVAQLALAEAVKRSVMERRPVAAAEVAAGAA